MDVTGVSIVKCDYRQLGNTKSHYQLIKTTSKFEKEIRNWLYIFVKKNQLTWQNA